MLRMLSTGWSGQDNSDKNITSSSSLQPSQSFKSPSLRVPSIATDNTASGDNDDDFAVPSFPLPGSIQRAGASRVPPPPSFDVSPPSPTSSSSSRSSTPPTPKAQSSNKPKPSHRAFPAESDDILNGLALPPSTTAIPPKVRRKEALQPGHSALDWARYSREGDDDELRCGFDKPQRIPMSEVAEHKRKENAWSVYNGKVYNITPYLNYHPGGASQLMKAAGKDGTELFMKTHAWVNADLMMESCLIGYLVEESRQEEW